MRCAVTAVCKGTQQALRKREFLALLTHNGSKRMHHADKLVKIRLALWHVRLWNIPGVIEQLSGRDGRARRG